MRLNPNNQETDSAGTPEEYEESEDMMTLDRDSKTSSII